MLDDQEKNALWESIEEIDVAMLTSHDGATMRSRPMHKVQKEFDGTLWFFNDRASHKTEELSANPQVNVVFSDVDNDCYVSMSGVARISDNREMINRLWNPVIDAWFPDGKESPNVSLLEIVVNEAETWQSKVGTVGKYYELAKAKVTGTRPDVGENRKYS